MRSNSDCECFCRRAPPTLLKLKLRARAMRASQLSGQSVTVTISVRVRSLPLSVGGDAPHLRMSATGQLGARAACAATNQRRSFNSCAALQLNALSTRERQRQATINAPEDERREFNFIHHSRPLSAARSAARAHFGPNDELMPLLTISGAGLSRGPLERHHYLLKTRTRRARRQRQTLKTSSGPICIRSRRFAPGGGPAAASERWHRYQTMSWEAATR